MGPPGTQTRSHRSKAGRAPPARGGFCERSDAPAAENLSKLLLSPDAIPPCPESTEPALPPPGRTLMLKLFMALSRASLIRGRGGRHLSSAAAGPQGTMRGSLPASPQPRGQALGSCWVALGSLAPGLSCSSVSFHLNSV